MARKNYDGGTEYIDDNNYSFVSGTVGMSMPSVNIGYTQVDVGPTQVDSPNYGDSAATEPMRPLSGFCPTQPDDSSDLGHTVIVSPGVAEGATSNPPLVPVVGWLVCTKGVVKGKDFRLHAGFNVLGRSDSVDVSIPDNKVSLKGMIKIAYEMRGNQFYITPYEGASNIAYHNDRPVFETQLLKAFDTILVGDTELKFVPFYCEQNTWEE